MIPVDNLKRQKTMKVGNLEGFENPPKISDRDIIEMFGNEGIQSLKTILELKQEQKNKLDKICLNIYKHFCASLTGNSTLTDREKKLWVEYAQMYFYFRHIAPLDRELRRMNRTLKVYQAMSAKPGIKSGSITPDDIARAKEVPIENFVSFNHQGFCKSIFKSNERTSSMKLVKDKNRFHCFSSSRDGDVIDVVMHLYGKTFIDAVKFLINK